MLILVEVSFVFWQRQKNEKAIIPRAASAHLLTTPLSLHRLLPLPPQSIPMRRRVPIKVIHEDNHLIAVDKPAGMLVHGDETGDVTLVDHVKLYIKERYDKPGDVFLGVIHRLDRPVSGVVVFARTSKALTRMNESMRKKEIDKTYVAIVSGRMPEFEGRLIHHVLKDTARNYVHVYNKPKSGTKEAETHYRVLGEVSGLQQVEVKPITGRPHQLRVQLSKVGCPIVGDLRYGTDRPNQDQSLCLHCTRMSFLHPVRKEPVVITSYTPKKQYWDFFE